MGICMHGCLQTIYELKNRLNAEICVCVCVYVCMCVHMKCTHMHVHPLLSVCLSIYQYVCMYICENPDNE